MEDFMLRSKGLRAGKTVVPVPSAPFLSSSSFTLHPLILYHKRDKPIYPFMPMLEQTLLINPHSLLAAGGSPY